MADRIDDIVDPIVNKQIGDVVTQLGVLQTSLKDNLDAALQLNQALAQSGSLRQLRENVQQAAAAQERLAQAQLRTQQAQERLTQLEQRTAQQRAQTQAAEERTERQRQTNEANDQRRAAAASQRSQQATQRAREQSRPYQLLTLALREAEAAASDLGTVFGANSPQFQQAAARVQELRTQVDSIEQPLGRFQRNVGNYASGVTGALQTGFGYLRTAANIIPGLGLSGIFLAAFEGIKYVVQQFGFFSSEANKAKNAAAELNGAFESSSVQKAVANVNELRINIGLAKDGFLDKKKVVDQYNESIGKTTGRVNNLNEAESALIKNADAYIRVTALKAAANLALEDAAKQTYEIAKVQNQTGAELRGGFAEYLGSGFRDANPQAYAKATEAIRKTTVEPFNKAKNDYLRIAKDLQSQAAKISKDFNFNFFDDNKEDKQKKVKDTSMQDQLAAIDRSIKRAADANDAIQKSEDASYEDRIKSANNFVSLTSDLLEKRKDVELSADKLSKQARINIANDTQDKIRDVENKGAADIIKVNQDLTKGLEDTYNRQIKGAQDADKATIESIKSASAQRVQEVIDAAEKQSNALQEQRSSGVLSEKDYQAKLRDLQHASAVAQIDEQLATLQFIINAKKAAGQATATDEEALNKLLRQRNGENFKFQADQQKTELQQRKEFFQKVIEFANEAAKAVQAAIDGAYQSRIDTLSKESDAIAENGDREKAAVDRSLLSSEEKARKEAVIDARTKARQDAITKQQNQLKKEQAEIDRAFSIASIIENTAVGISKTIGQTGFLGIPLTAVIAAIGAAQIATILATPLPKYKDGVRNKSQGSWSIFGEAGTEYVKEPGKQGYLTEGPTVGWLPAGTDVISNRELMAAMANPGKTNYISNQLDLSALLQEQQTTRRELTKALEVKQDANYKRGYRNGKQFSEYINRNVR